MDDMTYEWMCRVIVAIVILGTPIIAYKKGRNPFFWFCVALLLQPFALLTIILAGPQKKCIHCGKRMDVDLNECPICAKLQDPNLPRDPRNKKKETEE